MMIKEQRNTSYISAVRHPWPCLVFLVPLLGVYECGVIWLSQLEGTAMRNGADAWLRWAFESFDIQPILAAPAAIIGILLIACMFRWSERPSHVLGIVFGMVIESVLFAGVIWVVGRNFTSILSYWGIPLEGPLLNTATQIPRDAIARMVTFIGAGIYEEVIFRLFLFAGLSWLLRFCLIPWIAAIPIAMVVSSLLFAMAHHIGPHGEPVIKHIFLFRFTAGMIFAMLYWCRGFGVAVGAHAVYDIFVGLTPTS